MKGDPYAKALGTTLRTLRKLRGYKINAVVEKTGFSSVSITAWENGKYFPTICKLRALTTLYRVQLSTVIVNAEKVMLMHKKVSDED